MPEDHAHSHSGHSHSHDDHVHSHEDHGHEGHSHGKIIALHSVNNAFIIGIILNLAFVVIEAVVGLIIHSLSLLSDAGHNLADVASLGFLFLPSG